MSRPIIGVCAAGAMLFACKTSQHTELSASGQTESTRLESAQTDTVTTVTTGPERVTTTTEEFAPPPKEVMQPEPVQASPAGVHVPNLLDPATRGVAVVASHGPLVKRTVKVEERGPVSLESHSSAIDWSETTLTAKSDVKAVQDKKSAPSMSCGFVAWLVPAALIAALWWFRKLLPWWPK